MKKELKLFFGCLFLSLILWGNVNALQPTAKHLLNHHGFTLNSDSSILSTTSGGVFSELIEFDDDNSLSDTICQNSLYFFDNQLLNATSFVNKYLLSLSKTKLYLRNQVFLI